MPLKKKKILSILCSRELSFSHRFVCSKALPMEPGQEHESCLGLVAASIPAIVSRLLAATSPDLQVETAWILTQLASFPTHCNALAAAGAIDALASLLSASPQSQIQVPPPPFTNYPILAFRGLEQRFSGF